LAAVDEPFHFRNSHMPFDGKLINQGQKTRSYGRNIIVRSFEWQLHVPVIVFIPGASLEIMYFQEMQEGNRLIFLLVFFKMLENKRKLQQLLRFCCSKQVDQKKRYRYEFFHHPLQSYQKTPKDVLKLPFYGVFAFSGYRP
jgi:hypothetical protein